jgi:hypothetical protein
MRVASLVLREGDRGRLTTLTRSTSVRAGLAQRARIIVLAADGESNTEISKLVGTVISWRARYAACGIDGLADEKRSGRPRAIDHRKIVSETQLVRSSERSAPGIPGAVGS